MATKQENELLKLLNSRRVWTLPEFRERFWSEQDLLKIDEAAQLHARAYTSDPHAYGRMRMHLRRGLDDAAAVIKDAQDKIAARHAPSVDEAA